MPSLSLLIKPASGLCNYRCRYCFYTDEMNRREQPLRGIMTEETLSNLVRRAFAYADGELTFSFQGGEPTLAGLDFFRKFALLEKSYSKPVRVSNAIQTNGSTIDDEWADFLAEHNFLVGLSVDGTRPMHDAYRKDAYGNGTYDATVRAAELLRKHKVDYNILCVVNKDVCAQPTETFETLMKYGFVQFIPCLSPLETDAPSFAPDAEAFGRFLIETFDIYERELRAGRYVSERRFDNYLQMLMGFPPESCAMCGQCTVIPTIEADGSVYPCDFYAVDAWKLGNVNADGFGKMLRSEAASEFIGTSLKKPETCRACEYLDICRGGCRREREPHGIDCYCEGYRLFFKNRLANLRKLADENRHRVINNRK